LEIFARLRAEAAIESRDELYNLAREEAATSNLEPMEIGRQHMMKNRQANLIAISQATEFPPPTQEE
jgi:hypothetical protein